MLQSTTSRTEEEILKELEELKFADWPEDAEAGAEYAQPIR